MHKRFVSLISTDLDVKMFIKGVETYLESIVSVPFVPNKKMLWLAVFFAVLFLLYSELW